MSEKIKAKIKKILTYVGWFLMCVTGIIIIYAAWVYFKPVEAGADTELGATSDDLKKVDKNIPPTYGNERYAELAEKMAYDLSYNRWFNMSLSVMQNYLMQIKHYGDYLRLKQAFGKRSIDLLGNEGTLTDFVMKHADELARTYYNQYVRSLYDNYLKHFKK